MTALQQILRALKKSKPKTVAIPALWVNGRQARQPVKTDYVTWLSEKISAILKEHKQPASSANRTHDAIVYNILIRLFSAYDHNRDGQLGGAQNDHTLNADGVRETGTFLKTIALLPYLKSLGVNTIHLLPVTEIGQTGRKGDLGSPYAIRHPFRLEPTLADPAVPLSIDMQYRALIEAAHRLGMRVVQEFIFRTAAIDSAWTAAHPDWFYWIKKGSIFRPPRFTKDELREILKIPKGKGKYIPPHAEYRNLFARPPEKGSKHNLQIPGAFADWPPDDKQPPWSDVTYLRMYHYPYEKKNNFNYIAYNTTRYYDPELAKPEHINEALWHEITGIIPWYQKEFGIDGAMIDMGHALPDELKKRIIEKARSADPGFAFWDENFDNKPATKREGYDAVIGDAWHHITRRNGFRKLIRSSMDKKPLPWFGAAETHNTPRYGYDHMQKKRAAWLLFLVIPGAIPFLHNGFELNEQLPVNTGLNFSKAQIDYFSKQQLPLFHKNKLNWDSATNIIPFIRKVAGIMTRFPWIFDKNGLSLLSTTNKKVMGFQKEDHGKTAIILFNTNFHGAETFFIPKPPPMPLLDLLTEKIIDFSCKNVIKRGGVVLAIDHISE